MAARVKLGKGWNVKYPATPIEEAKAAIGKLVLSMHKVSPGIAYEEAYTKW